MPAVGLGGAGKLVSRWPRTEERLRLRKCEHPCRRGERRGSGAGGVKGRTGVPVRSGSWIVIGVRKQEKGRLWVWGWKMWLQSREFEGGLLFEANEVWDPAAGFAF